ncbi:uncharacterized protein DS421_19g665310 [Arachis hypogaea]|uniref:Transposase MuDR plant domain-containing protein n=1 Tax=Arachis hypogaea TaxID=3818 RepID=A0A6B9VFF1_ARAHY|nr:uncharacterized protein DS421_19g665310 [Arachis hypogaea]
MYVEQAGNFGVADLMPGQEILRARSPTFNAFVTPGQTVTNCRSCPSPSNCVPSPEGIVDGLAETSDEDDSGEEAEVVPKTQPVYHERDVPNRVESVAVGGGGGGSSSTPGYYLSLNLGAMMPTTAEDTPSKYALSGEMELEVGLKFLNRETAMLAVKNYNIRRSAKYKVVE